MLEACQKEYLIPSNSSSSCSCSRRSSLKLCEFLWWCLFIISYKLFIILHCKIDTHKMIGLFTYKWTLLNKIKEQNLYTRSVNCPVSCDCWIHWLLLYIGVRHPPNQCPRYDTEQSNGEIPVMLELWRIRSTPLLPSPPGSPWLGMVAPDKSPIYGLNRTESWFLEFTVFCI